MRAALTWVYRNADDFFAIVLAACFVALGYLDIAGTTTINNAILLVLGARTAADLRDRARRRSSEQEQRHEVDAAKDELIGALKAIDGELRREFTEATGGLARTLDSIGDARVLKGAEVGAALTTAMYDTERWHFRGGTGGYTRAVTLPRCVEYAHRAQRRLEFWIQILDPTDETVCREFANFSWSLAHQPDATGEPWTADRARKESYASILAACWYQEQYRLLNIEVRLNRTMTTIRWDLSSSCLIMTQGDPHGDALMLQSGRRSYNYWDVELRESFRQAIPVPLKRAADVPLLPEPDVETVRRLFEHVGLALPESFSDRDVAVIIQKAIQPLNPFQG